MIPAVIQISRTGGLTGPHETLEVAKNQEHGSLGKKLGRHQAGTGHEILQHPSVQSAQAIRNARLHA